MSIRNRMYRLLENIYANDGDKSDGEERELTKKSHKRNPFIKRAEGKFVVGFHTVSKKHDEPLYWCVGGFKQLEAGSDSNAEPELYDSREDAEAAIRKKIVPTLRRQGGRKHLIVGWD